MLPAKTRNVDLRRKLCLVGPPLAPAEIPTTAHKQAASDTRLQVRQRGIHNVPPVVAWNLSSVRFTRRVGLGAATVSPTA